MSQVSDKGKDQGAASHSMHSLVSIKHANKLYQEGHYVEAMQTYLAYGEKDPKLKRLIRSNILLCQKKLNEVCIHEATSYFSKSIDPNLDEVQDIVYLTRFIAANSRNYKELTAFNQTIYIKLYPKLAEEIKKSGMSYQKHYLKYGREEGRAGSFYDCFNRHLDVFNGLENHPKDIDNILQKLQRLTENFDKFTNLSVLESAFVAILSYKKQNRQSASFNPFIYFFIEKDKRHILESVDFENIYKHINEASNKDADHTYSLEEARCKSIFKNLFNRRFISRNNTQRGDKVHVLYTSDKQELHNIDFTNFSCAVHVHVFYLNEFNEILKKLSTIPVPFDLYVTYSTLKRDQVENSVNMSKKDIRFIANANYIQVPNKGRNMLPFVVTLAPYLIKYKFILHLHTKASFHTPALKNWAESIYSPYCIVVILFVLHCKCSKVCLIS